MIIESRDKLDTLLPYLSVRLSKALAYLRDTDFDKLPDGEYEIEGKDIYAKVRNAKTKSKEGSRPETHKKYIDVQYIISGEELICCAPKSKAHVLDEENLLEDTFFYKSCEGERDYLMKAGQLMVIFPWEVHRGSCHVANTEGAIRKVVIKVRVNG